MSVDHTIKDDIFTLEIEGEFSKMVFVEALERGMADPAFKAPMRALIDARQAETWPSVEADEDRDRLFAEIRHCFIPHWAIVARSDIVLFDVARMICTCSDLRGIDMRAYGDIEEARSRLTWSNSHQQDPFCRMQTVSCRPHIIRPPAKS